jgi:hypothetical protein
VVSCVGFGLAYFLFCVGLRVRYMACSTACEVFLGGDDDDEDDVLDAYFLHCLLLSAYYYSSLDFSYSLHVATNPITGIEKRPV